MPLPTLLQTGFVIPPKGATKSERDRIDNMTGSSYLMNYISDRIPVAFGMPAKVKPTSPGDKVIIIKSGTGSGKSTVIPTHLYEQFHERVGKNITITQPRILTTKDISEGIPINYKFMKIDINLGFSTGSIKRLPKERGVIYMTVGTLLTEMNNKTDEEIMRKYSFILVDEVHERSISVDILLYKIKKLLENNFKKPECPFILLMSATFNPEIYLLYYNSPPLNYMEFKGSTFPIEQHYAKFDVPNYIEYASNLSEELHVKNISDIDEGTEFRDILIFVQGATQVKKLLTNLHNFNAKILTKPFSDVLKYINDKESKNKLGGTSLEKRYYIAPIELTSVTFNFGGTEYQNLFSPIDRISIPIYNLDAKGNIDPKNIQKWVKPTRRIIIATNVAETGVTIETLKYCIDTGYVFNVSFNPDFGSELFIGQNISKDMAIQRKGRVGRKSPGKWYPCYTEKVFNNLPEYNFADILSADITSELLNIILTETESQLVSKEQQTLSEYKRKQTFFVTNYLSDSEEYMLRHIKPLNFASIDLFEYPSSTSLVYSFEKLYGLGFINNNYQPTIIGYYSKGFSKISIESIRMLFAGYSYGVNILDLITIISFLVTKPRYIFSKKYKPFNTLKPKVDDKNYEFYYKTIIGDQFVEYLLIWESYSDFLNNMMDGIRKKANNGKPYMFCINEIIKWCEDHMLLYSGLVAVSKARTSIIESMLSIGLNPYYNGMGLEKGKYNLLHILKNNLNDGIAEIKKIKKCILEGYKFNLLVWDDNIKKYIHHHRNIPVQINRNNLLSRMGDDAVQRNANFIIPAGIKLNESFKIPGVFEFNVSEPISIMDSLDIDLKFLLH